VMRYIMDSYLVLFLASVLLRSSWSLRLVLLAVWYASLAILAVQLRRNRHAPWTLIGTALLGQLPGIAAGVCTAVLAPTSTIGVFASGLLEAWVFPVLPVLELLPVHRFHGASSTYVGAMAAPWLPALVVLTSHSLGVMVRRYPSIRPKRSS